ncbi:MAG: hypothetical protein ACK417_01825 [Bacteroidia bacterium]
MILQLLDLCRSKYALNITILVEPIVSKASKSLSPVIKKSAYLHGCKYKNGVLFLTAEEVEAFVTPLADVIVHLQRVCHETAFYGSATSSFGWPRGIGAF